MAGSVKMFPKNVTGPLEKARPKALMDCAMVVEHIAKVSMKPGGGKKGVPSPPGTPPHVQDGHLRSSIASALHEGGAIVGAIEKYGVVHEYGGVYHPPRPFMVPALQQAINEFPKKFENII